MKRRHYNRAQSTFDFTGANEQQSDYSDAQGEYARAEQERQNAERARRAAEWFEEFLRQDQFRKQRQKQDAEQEFERAQKRRAESRRSYYSDPAADRAVLGVTAEATLADIRAAWKALIYVSHPDKGGDADKFRAVQSAYENLKKYAA